jgi:hypothetical protein
MSVVRWMINLIHMWIEKLKGSKTITPLPVRQAGMVKVVMVDGYEFTIYVNKKEYRETYVRWKSLTKDHGIYCAHATVSHKAPELLKAVCETTLELPALLPGNVPEEIQREYIVRAYVDVLIDRVKALKRRA